MRGRSKYIAIVKIAVQIYGHIREGGLCSEWPLKEKDLHCNKIYF